MRYFILILTIIVTSCNDPIFVPKPRMYPRVDFPQGTMVRVQQDYCKLSFEFPDYSTTVRDSFFFDGQPADPCWFDLRIPALNAEIHCSYTAIDDKTKFDDLISDAFKLAGKHNTKANYRKESLIENKVEKVYGLLFNIEGPVATPIQFYLTDSTSNFFRGSLYFNDKVDPDSTKVLVDFLSKDINHMIETFTWR